MVDRQSPADGDLVGESDEHQAARGTVDCPHCGSPLVPHPGKLLTSRVLAAMLAAALIFVLYLTVAFSAGYGLLFLALVPVAVYTDKTIKGKGLWCSNCEKYPLVDVKPVVKLLSDTTQPEAGRALYGGHYVRSKLRRNTCPNCGAMLPEAFGRLVITLFSFVGLGNALIGLWIVLSAGLPKAYFSVLFGRVFLDAVVVPGSVMLTVFIASKLFKRRVCPRCRRELNPAEGRKRG